MSMVRSNERLAVVSTIRKVRMINHDRYFVVSISPVVGHNGQRIRARGPPTAYGHATSSVDRATIVPPGAQIFM